MESILWFLIVGGLFFFMMRYGCGGHGGHGKHGGGGCGGGHGGHDKHGVHETGRQDAGATTVKDPVCGMEIAPDQAFSMVRKGGRQHYFCSEACAGKFNAEPDRYAEGG